MAIKWLAVIVLIGICSQSSASSEITVNVFMVTSKSMTVRWSRFSGASSYKITATPKNSLDASAFAQFGANSVMGSINSLTPNIMYIIKAEAMDNSLNILSQAEVEETTAPEVPTIHMATSKQSESMTVEFTRVSGATSYVLRAENADLSFSSETEVSSSPGTVVNLQAYTDYTLSVMSVNSGGRSQPSLPVEAKTVVAAPELNSTSPRNDTIVVGWEPVDHAVLYTLSIIKEGSDSQVKLNTTDTSVTFPDLEAGTTYCIKSNAWDPEHRQGDDFTVCQITCPPIPGFIELQLTMVGSGAGVSVSWTSSRGAGGYLALSSEGINCTSTTGPCSLVPVGCGQRHTVTVTAINVGGPSIPSAPEEFIAFPCPPEPLRVEETEAGNCSVSWDTMLYADTYVAFIKRDDGQEERCNTTSTSCNYHCQCGYTYLMTVFAFNLAGSSSPGPVLNYTTLPCCPEDVFISLASSDTLEIMWSAVRGAEVYETRAVDGSEVILCNDTAPVCALSDLSCNSPYSVLVMPCNEIRGCNPTCTAHTKETAPCSPEVLGVAQTNGTSFTVSFSAPNTAGAIYRVSATGQDGTHTCTSNGTSCEILDLPCGQVYEVIVIATTSAGDSLPSYSIPLETAPCCPLSVNVDQVTQAMTNVTWLAARGAQTYLTSLTSPRGTARCHTLDTNCLMGCITCGTNYTVGIEAISRTGQKSECTYHGFSSSACCPSGVKLYRMANNTLRAYWRSTGGLHKYMAEMVGSQSNYTCAPPPGGNTCDVSEIMCGDVYKVVVAPLTQDGAKVQFCPQRMYSVSCSGSNVGMVIYRGKRSLD
ncbi:fibronectin type III domain-containing protein 7 [Esox lucius]|uniref:fibronectin type III domain-containing protein 7 n=1 Tax=Esox lucius TaxID=8010 RepID=UPI001477258E|nr:fibronectin type III domain-containing protein 7 [Esox lucius]XP_034149704.1 fibronectin type III domain-containing protein 7 [Esox lucius]